MSWQKGVTMAYEVVWVAYSKKKPYLPVCVAKTPDLLAEAMGVKPTTVWSTWTNFRKGRRKHARYATVFIEKDE